MLIVHVELDSRRLGGSLSLIPFADAQLSSHTCRDILQNVLDIHLERPTALLTAEVVHMYCIKQHDTVNGSGRNSRVAKEMANASACIDMKLLSVINAFSKLYFSFKIWSLPTTLLTQARVNPFELMRRSHTSFTSLPMRLDHVRMYTNHHRYNALIDFLRRTILVGHVTTPRHSGIASWMGCPRPFSSAPPLLGLH